MKMKKSILIAVVLFCACSSTKSTSNYYQNRSSKSTDSNYNQNNKYTLERFRDLKAAKSRVYKNNYQIAIDAFFAEDWKKAITYLNIVLNSKPDADAFFMRAYSKTRISDFSGAINDYFNAIELRPSYVFAYNNLASINFNNFNVIDSSINYLNTALSYDSEAPLVYLNLAIIQNTKGSFEQAIKNATRAIDLNVEDKAGAYQSRGKAKRNLKQYSGAIDDLKKSISLNSKYSRAYFELGLVYYEKSNDYLAINNFNSAIEYGKSEKNDFLSVCYYNRALAKQSNNNFQGAIDDFEMSRKLDSKSNFFDKSDIASVYLKWGNRFFEQKKWNSAIQKFNEAKRLDSSLTNDCNYNICSCYINIGLEYTNDDDSIVNELNSLRYSPNSDRYLQLENMRNENLRNSLKFMLIAYDYDKKRKSLVEMISQIYGILGNKLKEKEFDTISQVLK